MPYYEFECEKCSHKFEEFQTIANIDVPLKAGCPSCKKSGYVQRLISGADICDPVSLGVTKVPNGYNEVIRNIQKNHPLNTMEVRD
jgi:putative FmdB family regulatory protein|tara:strand:+ start:2236 stop:2493 length:258 start_codon:yes stop_codon:yes gene_type:complete